MALQITSQADNVWLIKRLAISATHYFSVTTRQRYYMQKQVGSASSIDTAETLRATLKIQPRAWSAFMDEFFRQGGVIREFNGRQGGGYHEVQTDKSESPAFKDQPLYGDKNFDALMQKLQSERKQQGEQRTPSTEAQREGLEDESGNDGKLGELQERLRKERDAAEARAQALKKDVESLTESMKKMDANKVLHIELKTDKAPEGKRMEMVHKTTPDLLVRVNCGLNVYLVGPAGSGKTTAAEKVAEALGLSFGFMSVGPQTTKSDVFGYMDAKGEYVPTEFRRRFEQGGVFLFDEIDAAHPGVLTQINAALAGSSCAFPDKMVKKHESFRCIAAGNTYGTGPDRVYVGRQELDGASLDRFDFLEWSYDEALECELAITVASDKEVALKWTAFVQSVRKSVSKLGIRHVVSPRATLNGVKLLCAGVSEAKVRETSLYKSLKPDDIKRIEANLVAA